MRGRRLGQRVRARRAREVVEAQPQHRPSGTRARRARSRRADPVDERDERSRRASATAGGGGRAPAASRSSAAGRRAAPRRGSRLCASACRWRPAARPRSRPAYPPAARPPAPTVMIPRARSFADVTGPTPHSRSTGSGCRNASSPSGGTTSSPSGLATRARDLGEELRPRDPDRDRQADLARAPRARSRVGDLRRRAARSAAMPAHVEERLVDRQPLDERRRVLEDLEHGLARLRVGRHPRRDDDRVAAQPPRLRAAHRRPHAERLRLVARRQHDARRRR